MTDGRYRDAGSGQFVSAGDAAADPGGTTFDTFPPSDRLQEITDELTAATDTLPVLTLTCAGIIEQGTDRLDVYERLLVKVREKVEAMG